VRYADRYRAAVGSLGSPLGTGAPAPTIVDRVVGTTTTDFGAPDAVLASDRPLLVAGEPERLVAFLDACWAAFDAARRGGSAGARWTMLGSFRTGR
jgi:hypothetical protein